MNIKLSKYNVIKSIENDTWIFNCLTSGFVKVNTNYWNELITRLKNSTVSKSDSVLTLIKAGILIETDKDELSLYKFLYYSEIFQNFGLSLSIAPTMRCNFNCFYCFEDGNKNSGIMNEKVENNLIKFISLHREQNIHITWFGGEPLLGFNKIISICKKLHGANIKFTSDMITNGSLLNNSVIKDLDKLNLNYIQISLDGLANVHDKRRIFRNGKPSFNIIIENIRKLLENTQIPLSIKVTIDHTNSSAYGDICRYFEKYFNSYLEEGRVAISHNFVKNRTDFDKDGNCFTSNELLDEYIKAIQSPSDTCMQPLLPSIAKPCMFRCKSSLAIDSDGRIYKCLEHLGNPSLKIGDLSTGIVSNFKMAKTTFANSPFDSDECKNCNVFPICGGGCPVDRLNLKNKKKVNYCSHYKNNLADLLPYFYKHQYILQK